MKCLKCCLIEPLTYKVLYGDWALQLHFYLKDFWMTFLLTNYFVIKLFKKIIFDFLMTLHNFFFRRDQRWRDRELGCQEDPEQLQAVQVSEDHQPGWNYPNLKKSLDLFSPSEWDPFNKSISVTKCKVEMNLILCILWD